MTFVTLLIGFLMLVFGANILVEGVVKIAKRFKISTMIISMTILAIGTSTPELAIACISSLKHNQITLSNNIGSNISTIAMSVGLTSIFYTIYIKKSVYKEIMTMLAVQILLLVLLLIGGTLDFIDGIIFLVLFVIYMVHLIKKATKLVSLKNEEDVIKTETELIEETSNLLKNNLITLIIFIVVGTALVVLGGNIVVDSATKVADYFGLSEAFIGVTVVALGTTLPELSTAFVAARRKEYDIIIGNVLGSGVSNILLIVGTAATIHPIYYTNMLLFQLGFMLFFGLLMYVVSLNGSVDRKEGITLVSTYLLFIISALILQKI